MTSLRGPPTRVTSLCTAAGRASLGVWRCCTVYALWATGGPGRTGWSTEHGAESTEHGRALGVAVEESGDGAPPAAVCELTGLWLAASSHLTADRRPSRPACLSPTVSSAGRPPPVSSQQSTVSSQQSAVAVSVCER